MTLEVEAWIKANCRSKWYLEYHAKNTTEDFLAWWIKWHGEPKECLDISNDEYFSRMGFALMGYRGALGLNKTKLET